MTTGKRPVPSVVVMATPLASVLRWPVESQQRARRNALLASTALTQARHERHEVEEFLDAHAKRWARSDARSRAQAHVPPTTATPLRAAL